MAEIEPVDYCTCGGGRLVLTDEEKAQALLSGFMLDSGGNTRALVKKINESINHSDTPEERARWRSLYQNALAYLASEELANEG